MTSRRLAAGIVAAAIVAFGAAWWRGASIGDHPLTSDHAARLAPVAARVEGCLRQQRLTLSEANAPRLTSCVCAGAARAGGRYCFVGNGFVAFGPEALPHGVFRLERDDPRPRFGMAYVPAGPPVQIPQEFDRNFGSFGPSSEPRVPGWYLVEFCPGCD